MEGKNQIILTNNKGGVNYEKERAIITNNFNLR